MTLPAAGGSLMLSGASRGIGRALAGRGISLALNAREPGPLEAAADACRWAGAAELLHPVFRNYLRSGQLLDPAQAAGALFKVLEGDWEKLKGTVLAARQVLSRS